MARLLEYVFSFISAIASTKKLWINACDRELQAVKKSV